jgi:hypothetical protein
MWIKMQDGICAKGKKTSKETQISSLNLPRWFEFYFVLFFLRFAYVYL